MIRASCTVIIHDKSKVWSVWMHHFQFYNFFLLSWWFKFIYLFLQVLLEVRHLAKKQFVIWLFSSFMTNELCLLIRYRMLSIHTYCGQIEKISRLIVLILNIPFFILSCFFGSRVSKFGLKPFLLYLYWYISLIS